MRSALDRRPLISMAHLLAALLAPLVMANPVQAGWFTNVLKGAGEAGESLAGRHIRLPDGFGMLDDAARLIKGVAAVGKGVPLAAHATPEGHWKFVNKEGDVYTAGTAEEMQRVTKTLAPNAPEDVKVSLYLSDATVFEQRAFLDSLPPSADLYFVDGAASYRLARRTTNGTTELLASVRPNIVISLADRRMFDEAMFQLVRPLKKSNIRMLALEPGGPMRVSAVPGFDPATKGALVDAIDPAHAGSAFAAVRGQTVVVTGRVEAGRLLGTATSGADIDLPLETLTRAAEANDVNLVVLQASVPRQPGGRNWLWQKVEVAGLDDALKRVTFADFLNTLGASRGELKITATPAGQGRISLQAVPLGDWPAAVADDMFSEIVSHVTGNIITQAVKIDARDKASQQEQDDRIVSWLPSWVHIVYLASLVLGLFALPVTRPWWRRLWPSEQRGDYKGVSGYMAAKLARGLAFVCLFMPLAAWPALPVMLWRIVWGYLMLPVRFFRWLRGSPAASPT